jgi:mitochondrial fission protein ELM1
LTTLLTTFSGDIRQQPDIIIAAGHATHLTALALSKKTGAKTIIIMQPTLPVSWFDFSLIPEHDRPRPKPNILVTKGALNRLLPRKKKPNSGIIMIGGPSKHFGWDNDNIVKQIETLIINSPNSWLITTSRRTPKEILPLLQKLTSDKVTFVPVEQTDSAWVHNNLPHSEICWVTPDSVSMIYEALTAGCLTGIFTLPNPSNSRVVNGLQMLQDEKLILTLEHYINNLTSITPSTLKEADRCAQELLIRLAL